MGTTLEKLIAQQEQLTNRIKQEEAKERTRQRKTDTRRKILLGSLVESMMAKDENLRGDIHGRLESFLIKKIDRDVFGLAGGADSAASPSSAEGAENESAA